MKQIEPCFYLIISVQIHRWPLSVLSQTISWIKILQKTHLHCFLREAVYRQGRFGSGLLSGWPISSSIYRTNLALRNEKEKEIVARCLLETILWLRRRHYIIQGSMPSARNIMTTMTIIMIGTIFSQIRSPTVIKFFQVRLRTMSCVANALIC
jgi:hypothetical protein